MTVYLPGTGEADLKKVVMSLQQVGTKYSSASGINFTQSGTGAVTRTLQDKVSESLSVKDFGAVGDGSTDDTAAIQAAVTAAGSKGIVFFPAGQYKITSAISITSGINLRGVGTESIWKGATLGSVIAVVGNIVGFNIACDDSVTIEKLEFNATTGGNTATLVQIDTDNSTSVKCNYGSTIRDCMFTAAARGINAINILDFVFDNCGFYNLTLTSCQVEAANSLGNGDSVLTNCTFSGSPTSGHFKSGTMGGLRIENNKFNMGGGANTFAMIFGQGGTVSALGMSPLLIIGNSIEGVQIGILFQRTGSGTMTCNNIIINGNEIVVAVASGQAILSQVSGGNSNAWLLGGVVSGNFMYAANTSISLISFDAAQDINITDNQFMTNAASATAVSVGGTTARISQRGNAAGTNVTYTDKITASLGADVALNNVANYFDGPSIAQGTAGTWWVSGQVTVTDTAGSAFIDAKLWDGTTIIASGHSEAPAANGVAVISLSGFLASPAGNIRISCRDLTSTSGKILFNGTGNSKDSTISAIRLS